MVFKVFSNPGHSTILWWSALQNKALKKTKGNLDPGI